MITPELKDKLLSELVESGIRININVYDVSKKHGIDIDCCRAILDQFQELGFLYIIQKLSDGSVELSIKAKAHDFVYLGGFVGQDVLLKDNIKKLNLEIDLLCKELTPNMLDKAHKISELGAAIMSFINYCK